MLASLVLALPAFAVAPVGTQDHDGLTAASPSAERGSGIDAFLPHLPAAAAPQLGEASLSADRLRAAVEGGGVAPVVQQMMAESGASPVVPSLPAPTAAADLPGPVELPADVLAPIAGIHAAVEEASSMVGRLPADEVTDVASASLDALASWTAEQSLDGSSASRDVAVGPRPETSFVEPGDGPRLVPDGELPPGFARAVERAPEAALLISSAIDAHLPVLESALSAAHVSEAGTPQGDLVEGCDLLDQPPALCVASEADNRHVDNYMLTIDLGGDDVYTNTAGGAPFQVDTATFEAVSVLVDLSGDDHYEPEHDLGAGERLPTGAVVGSNAPMRIGAGAAFGGVGMLIDSAGDDIHRADAPVLPSDSGHVASAVVAQGAGLLGVGVLVDEAGSNEYVASAADVDTHTVGVAAQGVGAVGHNCFGHWTPGASWTTHCGNSWSGGALIDRGSGDTSYSIDAGVAQGPAGVAHNEHGLALRPLRWAFGQGAADLSSAVLYDGGGSDHFELQSAATGPDGTEDPNDRGFSVAWGQAYARAVGGAWLLTGEGDTRYEASAQGSGSVGWQMLAAQGASGIGASAVLDDAGGNDTYHIRHDVALDYLFAGSECCKGGHVFRPAPRSSVGQGAAQGGVALLRDRSGDDRYEFGSHEDVRVRMSGEHYERTSLHVDGLWAGIKVGQGAAWGQGVAGLFDDGDSDHYDLRVDRDAAVEVVPHDGVAPPATIHDATTLFVGQGAASQGSSAGLIDLGGHGDRFEADLLLDVSSKPDVRGAFSNIGTGVVQGMSHATASAAFVARGTEASIFSRPNWLAACPSAQSRGHGVQRGNGSGGAWLGCSMNAFAVGSSPGAALPARPSTVELHVGEAKADHHVHYTPEIARVAAHATVTDADGRPVAEQRLHFFLLGENVAGEPAPWYYVPARTDENGVAVAEVPLGGTGRGGSFAIQALFDGLPPSADGPGLVGANAHQDLVLE